jgi:hypothetical protein
MWLQICENIADVRKTPLDDVYDLSIIKFLNHMSYVNHKNNEIAKKYK